MEMLRCGFISSNIHSVQSKLHIALTGIPSPLAISVRVMITETPSDMTYETVKAEVLRRNSPSVESKFRTLLQDKHLEDRTPSFCDESESCPIAHMRGQAFVKQLFFSRIPSNVHSILSPMMEHTALEQLAASADRIMEFSGAPSSADNVVTSSSSSRDCTTSALDDIQSSEILRAIRELTRQVSHMCRNRSSSRDHSAARTRYRSFSGARAFPAPSICWYHRKFKDQADTRTQPCSYSSRGN
ncbi:uncharacterized protein LOC106881234 [Octopus bimaculoides]|uniref:uncharacterized protein LOC106881234 n=1 Tax=Octopus bimaculoides TaxID=37653 RepID=UPI00071D4729|nr:uncharacterized protein LOC106881234 [Octopus bimaculoides]|eukprot:XP_014787030.1 PREDICTED: uncharacterized protein LOC106881234 [Octopus bimaculoides]